jgi:hypothetical protein
MVRSNELREESILDAMDRGDFYSSTGVVLAGLEYDGERIIVEIEPRMGLVIPPSISEHCLDLIRTAVPQWMLKGMKFRIPQGHMIVRLAGYLQVLVT